MKNIQFAFGSKIFLHFASAPAEPGRPIPSFVSFFFNLSDVPDLLSRLILLVNPLFFLHYIGLLCLAAHWFVFRAYGLSKIDSAELVLLVSTWHFHQFLSALASLVFSKVEIE